MHVLRQSILYVIHPENKRKIEEEKHLRRASVKLKLEHPPPGHLNAHYAREGGNLDVALEGWGI